MSAELNSKSMPTSATVETQASRGILSRFQFFVIGRNGERSSAIAKPKPRDDIADLTLALDQLREQIERLGADACRLAYQDSRITKTADELQAALAGWKPRDETLTPLTEAVHRSLSQLSGSTLPVYLDRDLSPRASFKSGASPHRTIVISIPKAGTYFISELMRLMGLAQTHLHLSPCGFSDYRFASIQQMREEYFRYTVELPLERSADLIGPGQFAVGHLPRTPDVVKPLESFRKIFIHRDLRDALVSYQRFFVDAKRTGNAAEAWKDIPDGPDRMLAFMDVLGESFFNQTDITWLDEPDVYSVSFETLYGDRGAEAQTEAVEKLGSFLELPGGPLNAVELMQATLGNPTKTKSSERSKREKYWSDAVEAKFREFNGPELNAKLGHEVEQSSG